MPHTLVWIATTTTADPSVSTNWLGEDGANHAPGNGDTLVFNGTGTANVTPVDQSSLTGVHLITTPSNSSTAGTEAAGVITYWKLGASQVDYGLPDNVGTNVAAAGQGGAALFLLALGSTTCVVTSYQTNPSAANSRFPSFRITGTAVTINTPPNGGDVGVAVSPGETSTVAAANLAGGNVVFGSGVTWTSATVTVDGTAARFVANSAGGTVTALSGNVVINGTGLLTAVNIDGATVVLNNRPSSGNLATTITLNSGSVDFSGNPASGAVGTFNLAGGTIRVFSASQISGTGITWGLNTSMSLQPS